MEDSRVPRWKGYSPQRKIRGSISDNEGEPRARFLEKILNSEVLEHGEGIVGQVSKTGKAVLVENAQNDPRIVKHEDPSLTIRSIIFSPLIYNDKTLGVLAVANPANGLAFSETDFSLVNSIAEQAALAIRNSDAMNLRLSQSRMDADLKLASEVQTLFLAQKFLGVRDSKLTLITHHLLKWEVTFMTLKSSVPINLPFQLPMFPERESLLLFLWLYAKRI